MPMAHTPLRDAADISRSRCLTQVQNIREPEGAYLALPDPVVSAGAVEAAGALALSNGSVSLA